MSASLPHNMITQHVLSQDADYIQAVATIIQTHYQGQGPQWSPPPCSEIWPISMGGRAGVVGIHVHNRSCCVKLFYDKRISTRIRTFLGCAKAQKAYKHALRLQEAQIACPTPIGYIESRPWGPGIVITELIDQGKRLDVSIQEQGLHPQLIKALAIFLRTMHDRGITHQDLSPRNLLVHHDTSSPQVWILDYEDARFPPHVTDQARLQDLHHLDERVLHLVTREQRLEFLQIYAEDKYEEWKQALAQMLEQSHSKYVRAYRQTLKQSVATKPQSPPRK